MAKRTILNCSCGLDHEDIAVEADRASNGRPGVRYTCPTTGKRLWRFIPAAEAPTNDPAPKAPKEPRMAAASQQVNVNLKAQALLDITSEDSAAIWRGIIAEIQDQSAALLESTEEAEMRASKAFFESASGKQANVFEQVGRAIAKDFRFTGPGLGLTLGQLIAWTPQTVLGTGGDMPPPSRGTVSAWWSLTPPDMRKKLYDLSEVQRFLARWKVEPGLSGEVEQKSWTDTALEGAEAIINTMSPLDVDLTGDGEQQNVVSTVIEQALELGE